MKSIDISDILTDKAFKELKVGQILRFIFEGSPNDMKITKINRKSKKCWAVPTRLWKPEEVTIREKKDV